MAEQRTALIIDDHRLLRELYRAVLETGGFLAEESSNGAEALLWLQRKAPDIILADLEMPVLDGWGFLEFRARDPRIRQIPVLVISGQLADAKLRSSLSRLGVDQTLRKPVGCEELIGAVQKLLEKPGIPDLPPFVEAEADGARKDARVSFAIPLLIHARHAGDLSGSLHDLSAGGLGACLTGLLPCGEQITVRLDVMGRSVSLPGVVQWAKESRTALGYRHGIRFAERQADTFALNIYSFFRGLAAPRPRRGDRQKKPKSRAA